MEITRKHLGHRVVVNGEFDSITFTNDLGTLRKFKDDPFKGELLGIEFDKHNPHMHSLHGDLPEENGYYVPASMVELSKEQRKAVATFDGYQISSFSLIDVFEQDPCKDEFLALMEDWAGNYLYSNDPWDDDSDPFKAFPTLVRNLPWLESKGFIWKHETKTKLRQGMKIKFNSIHDLAESTYIYTSDNLLVNIDSGAFWTHKEITTLEELNETEQGKFTIIAK